MENERFSSARYDGNVANRGDAAWFGLALAFLVVVSATACKASFATQPGTPAPLAALKLHYGAPIGPLSVPANTLSGGDPFTIEAYAVDADGVYTRLMATQVVWIADQSVVRIQPASVPNVFPVGPGTVDISGTYRGFVASLPVVVVGPGSPPFPYLEINEKAAPEVGNTSVARARVRQSASTSQDVTDAATWTTSDSHVAIVEHGRVTALVPGNVEIAVTFNALSGWYRFSVHPRGYFF